MPPPRFVVRPFVPDILARDDRGHASGNDLMEIVRTVRPKMLIPVHTTRPDVYAGRVGDVCEVRVPKVGVDIRL